MLNPAQKETEEILEQLEKQIRKEYRKAAKEVSKKLNEYLQAFATKDEIKREQLAKGIITKAQYNEWRTGQIMIGQRWQEMRDSLAKDLQNASEIAKNLTSGRMLDVYALNHNYATFEVEKGSLVDTSYTLYNRRTVEHILQGNKIYPDPGRRTRRRIAAGQELAWNKQKIDSVMLQGILQGESNVDIGGRIRKVTKADWKSVIRYARTMTTGAENAGRIDSYKRAESMGIKLKQQWLATLDSRTRSSHRQLDGVAVEVGKKFPNGCKFPGDPEAPAAEIWNCRCTLIPKLTGIPNLENDNQHEDLSLRDTSHFEDDDYQAWKNGKVKSDPILKAKEIGERRKAAAIADYREAAKRLGVR